MGPVPRAATLVVGELTGDGSCDEITSLEVFVDISHSYVGDLEISLEHGGQTWMLSKQVGGSQDNLVKTYAVNAAGVAAGGRWTLVVADKATQDTGKLNRWQLLVR